MLRSWTTRTCQAPLIPNVPTFYADHKSIFCPSIIDRLFHLSHFYFILFYFIYSIYLYIHNLNKVWVSSACQFIIFIFLAITSVTHSAKLKTELRMAHASEPHATRALSCFSVAGAVFTYVFMLLTWLRRLHESLLLIMLIGSAMFGATFNPVTRAGLRSRTTVVEHWKMVVFKLIV